MKRFVTLSAVFVLATLCPTAFAETCEFASIGFYQDHYFEGEGCTSGNLTFFSFGFTQLSVNGQKLGTITRDDIMVRPSAVGIGLDFYGRTDAIFNRTFTVPERYYITYVVDPPPIVAGDEARLDPPSGPVTVSRWTCPDTNGFDPTSVNSILNNLEVNQYENAFQCKNLSDPYFLQVDTSSIDALEASVTYQQLAESVVVRMVIDFRPGTVRDLEAINGLTNVVPEPAAFFPLAIAALGITAHVRRRRKMLNS